MSSWRNCPSQDTLCDTSRQTCKTCSEPQPDSVLPKQISEWYEICFRKSHCICKILLGGEQILPLACWLSGRETQAGGGGGKGVCFLYSASDARSCSWLSKMRLWIVRVSQEFSNRKVELEQRAGTRQTSSVKDYPACHLGANIPINPSSSISPRET